MGGGDLVMVVVVVMMTKPGTMMIVDDDDGLTATSMNTKSTYVYIITVIRRSFVLLVKMI